MTTGPVGRFGEIVEQLVDAPLYRWVQRAVVIVTALLLLANAVILTEILAVDTATASLFWDAMLLGVAVFVLTGMLQVVAMGRRFDRGAATVQRAADDLEQAATDVEMTADELDAVSESIETAAEALEETSATTDEDAPMDPESVEEIAETVDETVDTVRERTEQALSRAEKAKRDTEHVAEGTPSAKRADSPSADTADTDEER